MHQVVKPRLLLMQCCMRLSVCMHAVLQTWLNRAFSSCTSCCLACTLQARAALLGGTLATLQAQQ